MKKTVEEKFIKKLTKNNFVFVIKANILQIQICRAILENSFKYVWNPIWDDQCPKGIYCKIHDKQMEIWWVKNEEHEKNSVSFEQFMELYKEYVKNKK